MKELKLPDRKLIRAKVIKDYIKEAGYDKVICFSCGNASSALKQVGLKVLEIAPGGDFETNRWWTQAEIKEAFPDYFDATSGHLPVELMFRIGLEFKKVLQKPFNSYYIKVPTGSGETVICLKMVYPKINFIAEYNTSIGTKYEEEAPLNSLVNALCYDVIK